MNDSPRPFGHNPRDILELIGSQQRSQADCERQDMFALLHYHGLREQDITALTQATPEHPMAAVRRNLLLKELRDDRIRECTPGHSPAGADLSEMHYVRVREDQDPAFYKVGVDFPTNRPVFEKIKLTPEALEGIRQQRLNELWSAFEPMFHPELLPRNWELYKNVR